MTVLQLCAYAAPYEGNFIKSLKTLSAILAENGDKVIYAFPESARHISWCKELSRAERVYFLPLSNARIRPSTYKIIRQILRENPDIKIIHSHFELYDIPAILSAPKTVRVFWHLHDAIENYKDFYNRLMHLIQYRYLHMNATLLSVSEKHRSYVIRLGFPKHQSSLVPNGIDLERVKPINSKSHKEYDYLMFGWNYIVKGVDLCISAKAKIPDPLCVAVVTKKNIADEIVNKYDIPEGIEFINPVNDVNALYDISKAFLHISRAEGQSYALLEAIYAGLPIICSDIPENRFAKQFENVYMVKSEDVDALATIMSKKYVNEFPSESSISRNREIIRQKFSVHSWAVNVYTIYKGTIQ